MKKLMFIEKIVFTGGAAAVLILVAQGNAWGYVDPGFLTSMYQVGYILVLGAMSFFIFRPTSFIKGLIKKLKGKIRPSPKSES